MKDDVKEAENSLLRLPDPEVYNDGEPPNCLYGFIGVSTVN
jgi:hypothetical protein